MAKNGNILHFFKHIPKGSQSSESHEPASSQPTSSQPSIPALPSSPPLPSSPSADQDKTVPRAKDTVIQGSDDEDDASVSSDDDLPNLFAKPRPQAAVQANRESNPCVTPKAKRTAMAFHSSPLAIIPKHKFDMKALLNHAKNHDAAEASAQRMSDMFSEQHAAADDTPAAQPAATLYETMMDVLPDAEDGDDEVERAKLLLAVKRTEASVDRKRWHFFEEASTSSSEPPRAPFPAGAAKGGWKFLADSKTRDHAFGDGLAYTIQFKRGDLPDEIFLWILDKISSEDSEPLREEYSRLLGICPQQIHQYLDEHRLDRLFQALGAREGVRSLAANISGAVQQDNSRYAERNWSMLQSILRFLSRASAAMAVNTLTRAVSILLRLGIDPVIIENIDIQKDFSEAIENLILAAPTKSWDIFCEEVCLSFHMSVTEASLWWHALSVLPLGTSRVVELRRRLALVYFFDDPLRGRQHPDENLSISAIIDHLEDHQFTVGRKTDYYELAARASILTVAIGDGCAPVASGDPNVVMHFDEDVDRLCRKIKSIWSGIDTGGAAYVSRLEARTAWQTLEYQLPYVVRTRPPPKKGILDLQKDEEEDPFAPKQRKFMAKFLKKDVPVSHAA